VRSLNIPKEDFVVLSADEGSIKRSLRYQKRLGGAVAIVDKRRTSATETTQANIIGATLKDKIAVIFDDMISTAGSIVGAANIAKFNGAREIYACATHGVLCGPAVPNLKNSPLKQVMITDSIPLPPEKQIPLFKVLSVAPILADAIKRIHFNESVSKLFE
jgi:ribose-phosphate pyrophosphokinase